MAAPLEFWITAHRDLADAMFSQPMLGRLESIKERLKTHGYSLKLDIGKRSTRATVTGKSLRAKSTYKSVDGFIQVEEARLSEMDLRVWAAAQGTEARQGRDACGSVHDGPVAIGDAPSDNPFTETKEGSEHV